jgi:hypothetical protein
MAARRWGVGWVVAGPAIGPVRLARPMAVLVDDLREYPHAGLPLRLWCHMAGDRSFDELHAFAARLGIDRARFQGDHYDLPPWLRASAVALGAQETSTQELIERMCGPRGDRAQARARSAGGRS